MGAGLRSVNQGVARWPSRRIAAFVSWAATVTAKVPNTRARSLMCL